MTAEQTAELQARIVVGVDGSKSSRAALRWAIQQAKLTGGWVEAVIAWHFPATDDPEPVDVDADVVGTAQRIIDEAVSAVDGVAPDVPVLQLVCEGNAVDVLVHAAKGADLLVLGSRGHGGFASAAARSVSVRCTLRARCPVLVLRALQ